MYPGHFVLQTVKIRRVSIYRQSIFSHNGATEIGKLKSATRDGLSCCSSLLPPPCMHLLSFLHHLQWVFIFLFSFTYMLFHSFSFSLLPSPALSFKSFSALLHLAPSPLLSIQSWSTDYTVTFCFILSETPEGKPFQDISQQRNTPTLSFSYRCGHTSQQTSMRTHWLFLLFCFTCESLSCHKW